MRVSKRSLLAAGGLVCLTAALGCAGKTDLKLEMTRETVVRPPEISSVSLSPSGKLDTRESAHTITVTLRGDPGLRATFDVEGRLEGRELREVEPGVYRGSFDVGRGETGELRVVGQLMHDPSGAHREFRAPGVVSAWRSEPPVETCTTEMAQAFDKVLRQLTSYFPFDQAELSDQARAKLDEHRDVLASNPLCTIYVLGHADEVGADAYNLELSEKRALAVVEYLASIGVSNTRIVERHFGESRPASDRDRTLNRRVELRAFNPYGS